MDGSFAVADVVAVADPVALADWLDVVPVVLDVAVVLDVVDGRVADDGDEMAFVTESNMRLIHEDAEISTRCGTVQQIG